MDERGNVGLYIAPNKAVAVWIGSGSEGTIMHPLSVEPAEDEPGALALRAARAVMRQGRPLDEVFVAIDCSYYTQYKLHSEFEDYHQIESTIKYDVEEAAATDAINLAVTFEITGKKQVGSEVAVYAADRQLLTDILLDVQEGGLDPTFVEPDVVCLARTLMQDVDMSEIQGALFMVLSPSSCYMIRPQADFAPEARTFLVGREQNITGMLSREIMLAVGSADPARPLNKVILFGDAATVDIDLLSSRTGLGIQIQEPPESLTQTLNAGDGVAPHEMMVAYGAALAAVGRGHKTDFRNDFMPYQGRRKVLEGSLRLVSISAAVFLAAVALFFQLKAFRINRDVSKLQTKLVKEHKAVTFGKSPIRGMSVTSSLNRELTRAIQMETGVGSGDDKSVPSKLTFFFEALNKTPKSVDINIRQVTVTERSMTVKGDTNSQSGTMSMVNQIKKDPRITINGERYSTSANRYTFQFNVEPKQTQGTRR